MPKRRGKDCDPICNVQFSDGSDAPRGDETDNGDGNPTTVVVPCPPVVGEVSRPPADLRTAPWKLITFTDKSGAETKCMVLVEPDYNDVEDIDVVTALGNGTADLLLTDADGNVTTHNVLCGPLTAVEGPAGTYTFEWEGFTDGVFVIETGNVSDNGDGTATITFPDGSTKTDVLCGAPSNITFAAGSSQGVPGSWTITQTDGTSEVIPQSIVTPNGDGTATMIQSDGSVKDDVVCGVQSTISFEEGVGWTILQNDGSTEFIPVVTDTNTSGTVSDAVDGVATVSFPDGTSKDVVCAPLPPAPNPSNVVANAEGEGGGPGTATITQTDGTVKDDAVCGVQSTVETSSPSGTVTITQNDGTTATISPVTDTVETDPDTGEITITQVDGTTATWKTGTGTPAEDIECTDLTDNYCVDGVSKGAPEHDTVCAEARVFVGPPVTVEIGTDPWTGIPADAEAVGNFQSSPIAAINNTTCRTMMLNPKYRETYHIEFRFGSTFAHIQMWSNFNGGGWLNSGVCSHDTGGGPNGVGGLAGDGDASPDYGNTTDHFEYGDDQFCLEILAFESYTFQHGQSAHVRGLGPPYPGSGAEVDSDFVISRRGSMAHLFGSTTRNF